MPLRLKPPPFARPVGKTNPYIAAVHRAPRSPHASPVADKVFKLDPKTQRYIGYKEFTPKSVVIPPEAFMERRFYDVLPANIAEQMDRSIAESAEQQTAVAFDCAVFGHWARTHVITQGDIYLNVTVLRSA